MNSPFPGMDPYLEPHWLDVHTHLVAYLADALNASLPSDLVAASEERVAIESEDGTTHGYGPDVRILEPSGDDDLVIVSAADGGAVHAPYRVLAQVDPITERFIKIVQAGTERLITVIEILSPTNKRLPGLQAFRSKRAEMLSCGVNFVEIDLVRAGDWEALLQPHRLARQLKTMYRVSMQLPGDPGALHLWPLRLQDPLPSIWIPLREKDPDVHLDLAPLLQQTYVNGRYSRRIDYRKPLDPPLPPEDAAWTDELLKNAAKR